MRGHLLVGQVGPVVRCTSLEREATHRSRNDPGRVELDGDVGVGDVLLLAEAPLDVAEEVVRVRQVLCFLEAWTEGNSILFFSPQSTHHIFERGPKAKGLFDSPYNESRMGLKSKISDDYESK